MKPENKHKRYQADLCHFPQSEFQVSIQVFLAFSEICSIVIGFISIIAGKTVPHQP